ncbi:hypothetical protein BH09VER1_BH09VER1_16910 [soil metagenome]
MIPALAPAPRELPALPPGTADPRYSCGTLVYTQAGLFTLFSWLIWGDFCFSLMENIWPSILPLMLKAQGTSNLTLALIITVIPSAMNFVLNPIISTASDRFRSPRGRRIPFLLAATPFVTLFLVLLGFAPQLGTWLSHFLARPDLTAAGVTVGLIAMLVASFRFFELFINTVFWYLFNDVVPVAFMGRFLAFFRIAGALAGTLFNFFLFKYAGSHASVIFLGVAILYGTMFFLMCLKVKEGAYPPPDPMPSSSPLAWIGTFFRECFTHRIFRLVFTFNAFTYMGNAMNTFFLFMAFSIGLTLDDVGKIVGAATFIGIFFMYPMGVLVDRFNPLRVMLVAQLGCTLALATKLIFLFFNFSATAAFWIYAATAAVAIPAAVASTAASMPMLMRIFPRERFGQFCAANAMCGAVGTMLGGVLAGCFLDFMKSFSPSENFYYRYAPAWSVLFTALSLVATWFVFQEWKKLGGEKHYQTPDVSASLP